METTETKVRYVELVKDIELQVKKGRYTLLLKGAPGFVIDEVTFNRIEGMSRNHAKHIIEMLEDTLDNGRVVALVEGSPVSLSPEQFKYRSPPQTYPVVAEIII